jgi:hypothetical protein
VKIFLPVALVGLAISFALLTFAQQKDTVDPELTELRASDGATLGIFNIVNGASGVAFDGANVWVTSEISGTVTKL